MSPSAETQENGGCRKAFEGTCWAETGKMVLLSWHEVCVPSSQGLRGGWAPWPGLQCQDPTRCWLALHFPRFLCAPVLVVALHTSAKRVRRGDYQMHVPCNSIFSLVFPTRMWAGTEDTVSDRQPCKLQQ